MDRFNSQDIPCNLIVIQTLCFPRCVLRPPQMFVVWPICPNSTFFQAQFRMWQKCISTGDLPHNLRTVNFFLVYFYCFHLWLQPFHKTVIKLHKTFTSGSCVLLFTRWINRFFFWYTNLPVETNKWSQICLRLRLLNGAQFFWTWLSQQDDILNTFTMGSCLQSNLTILIVRKSI